MSPRGAPGALRKLGGPLEPVLWADWSLMTVFGNIGGSQRGPPPRIPRRLPGRSPSDVPTRCTLPGPVEPRTLGLLYVPASAELSQSVDQAKASESQSLQLCGLDHFCTYAREGAAILFSGAYVPASAELSQSVDQAKASEP